MEVIFEKNDKKIIIKVEGDIIIDTSSYFKDRILEIVKDNKLDIELDLKNVEYIDSTGIGAMLVILKNLEKGNLKFFKIVNCSSKISDLIKLTTFKNLLG